MKRALTVIASSVLSLAIAETGARTWHKDAFPYLNIFAPDARYGVVLEPDATARVRSREGRVTEVSTNFLGFRGQGPALGGVLLLGDSQMLGYGVDAAAATSARLSALAGVPVLAAATPTWGPIEYARAVFDLVPLYHPSAVVFVANLANDWPEANVPNAQRTFAEDGWVVAKRPSSADFPGRSWLMGRSHLVFAARAVHALAGRKDRSAAERLLLDLPMLARPRGAHRSVVTRHLARVMETAECPVVVAVLPLDVEIHPAERLKYADLRDVTSLARLEEDFLADARALGAIIVDLRAPLVAASPGVFLPDDYHLSPKGHDVVARALAPAIQGASRTRLAARDEEQP